VRPAAGSALAAYLAEVARDQGTCPDSSPEGGRGELSGQMARNGECGVPIQYHHRDDRRRVKWIRKPCRVRSCPDCGPWMRRERVRRLTAHLDGWPVWLATVAEDRWPTLRRRLARAEAGHLRIPQPDGQCAVLASVPLAGAVQVAELAQVLAELLERQPLDDRRARAGGPWKLPGQAGADDDQDQDDAGPEWVPDGFLTAPPARLVELAQELGVDRGPLVMRGPGEGRMLQFPEDPAVWRRWKRWAGLVQDLPQRRRRRAELRPVA
jgi:hypothetical protein